LLAFSSFTYTENNGTVSFTNTSVNEESYSWDFGDGGTATAESPDHSYALDGTFEVCLTVENPDCGSHTSCQTIVIQTSVNISGIVEKENGVPVANVELNLGLNHPFGLTGTDGMYNIEVANGSNFTISPVKDTLYGNGVSGFDVFKVQRHILVVEALDSPYKIIAADVNRSNSVSTFDAFLMQQVILQILDTFPNNTSWRFIEKPFVFPDATMPFQTVFPEVISINGLMNDVTGLDFIAMKVGDVTLDANPEIIGDSPSEIVEMRFSNVNWQAGDQVQIPVRMNSIEELAALQANFEFDKTVLTFESISSAELPGLDETDFNDLFAKDGRLSLVWYDKAGMGQKVGENSILFYLNFKAKSAGQLEDHFSVQPFRTEKKAYKVDGSQVAIKTVFEDGVSELSSLSYKMTVHPNPFKDHVTVLLEIEREEEGLLSVYDLSGRLVYSEELLLETGANRVVIEGEHFPVKGAYLLQVKTERFVEVIRVVAE